VFERIRAILSYKTYVDSCKFPSVELFLIFKESLRLKKCQMFQFGSKCWQTTATKMASLPLKLP